MKRILLVVLFLLSIYGVYGQEFEIVGSGIVLPGNSCTYTLLKDGVPQTNVFWTFKESHSFVTQNNYAYITPAGNGKTWVTGKKVGEVILYAFPESAMNSDYPIAFTKIIKVQTSYSPYISVSSASCRPSAGAIMPTVFIEDAGDREKMTVDWYKDGEFAYRAHTIVNLNSDYSFELKAIATIGGKKYTLTRKIPVFNAEFLQKQDGANLKLEVNGFKEAIGYEWQSTPTMTLVSASNMPYALYKSSRMESGPAKGKVTITVSGGVKYTFYAGCYIDQKDINQMSTKVLVSESNLSVLANPVSPVSVKVYSFSTGMLVYQEKNSIDFKVKNTSLSDGIYIVVTTNEKGEVKSEKIVKTKN
ncbi:T9SS type A sorting domain-containing protein [Dysgonomonas sp.]